MPRCHLCITRTAPFTDPAIHALLKGHERNAGSPLRGSGLMSQAERPLSGCQNRTIYRSGHLPIAERPSSKCRITFYGLAAIHLVPQGHFP
jgi:hypothetical protein